MKKLLKTAELIAVVCALVWCALVYAVFIYEAVGQPALLEIQHQVEINK